jgi:hypothetical protein
MEKRSEFLEMSGVQQASEILQKRIAPVGLCQSVAERIRHASRKLGWSYSRTKEIWYRNARAIQYEEMLKAKEVAGIADGKNELKEIDTLIANADRLLDRKDPAVRRAIRAGIRSFLGTLYRTRTEGRGR